MGRRKEKDGWKRLKSAPNSEREKAIDPPPGEGGEKMTSPDKRKSSSKRKRRLSGMPQEGGHSQASHSEDENVLRDGGHSQSSNGVMRAEVRDGGHNQSSTGKPLHYGHFGRYNDQMDL